ncbi:hypothetical protein BGZ58_000777, partial [Dissophora ornata]
MSQNSRSRGQSNAHLLGANLSEIEVVEPNTPKSKTAGSSVIIRMPNDTRDTDPSNGGREKLGDETKTNDVRRTVLSRLWRLVSSSRRKILKDGKNNEKNSVNHEDHHGENPAPQQELGCEPTVNKTPAEMSTQQTSPGVKVKGAAEEKVKSRGHLKSKSPPVAKTVVEGVNGGYNDIWDEQGGVECAGENGGGDESKSEYNEGSEHEISPTIVIDEQDKDSSQKNKNDKGKDKDKGNVKDSDPARVEKPKNDENKFKFRLRPPGNRPVAKSKANPELGEETRVRLHRQIELPKDIQCQYIKFSINVEACDSLKFKLHYVELQRCNITDSKDIVLFGEGKPQEYITVGHYHDGDENHTEGPVVGVHSCNISSCGTYVTTLCFHEDNSAVVELWSLKNGNDVAPSHYTTPLAQRYVDIAGNPPDRAHICLSVSSNGYYVALHSNKPLEKSINCQVLRRTKVTTDGSDSELWGLSKISLPLGLQEFYGYGAFHFLSTKNENEQARESERYITCDGKSLSIYKTTGNWARIQTIKLNDKLGLDSGLNVILSLRGKYFTWTGKKNNVSVMHMDKGMKNRLKINGINAETRTCLSRDGCQVAILVKGWIDIYETSSGNRTVGFGDGKYDNSRFEVVLENGFVMMLDPPGEGGLKEKRKVVRTEGGVWVREHDIHPDYELRYPALMGEQLFTYSQGTVVNITRMDSKMIGVPEPGIFKDIPMDTATLLEIDQACKRTKRSNTYSLFTDTRLIHGKRTAILTIEFCNPDPRTSARPANAAIPLGTPDITYPTFFLKASSRLATITGRYLQVWKLSSPTTSDDSIAELELVWALQQEGGECELSDICYRQVKDVHADLANGAQFMITFKPVQRQKEPKGPEIPTKQESDKIVTFPFSNKDNLEISLEDRVQQGIRGVVDMYINGNTKCQKAVIRYLESLVQPWNENPVLCIVALCNLWRFDEKECFEKIMADLLPKTRRTWIPEINARNKNARQGPLAILLKKAETEPSAIGAIKVIMGYCISHANSSKDLKFLAPVFISMGDLRMIFPDEAEGFLNRMAFIHTIQRQHIIHNHILVHSPSQRLQFWRPAKKLWETKEPIMQLCENSDPDTANEKFTLPVFVASFDALWSYDLNGDGGENSMMTNGTSMETKTKMSRWRILLKIFRYKLRLHCKMYVTSHDFNLEIFDNPAIAALVAYK